MKKKNLALMFIWGMILTSVYAYGASANRVTKIITISQNTDIELQNAPILIIELQDEMRDSDFYISLEGASWLDYYEGTRTILEKRDAQGNLITQVVAEKLSSKELRIRVEGISLLDNERIEIPLIARVHGQSEAAVIVDGNNSSVTSSKVIFARCLSPEEMLSNVKGGDRNNIYKEGVIGDFTIEEMLANTLLIGSEQQRTIEIELKNKDFEFGSLENIKVLFQRGFSGLKVENITYGINEDSTENRAIIKITLPYSSDNRSRGSVNIQGLEVKCTRVMPEFGALNVQIKGDRVKDNLLELANIVEPGISAGLGKYTSIVEGKSGKVTFALREQVPGSIESYEELEILIENGYLSTNEQNQIEILMKKNTNRMQTIVVPTLKDEQGRIIGFKLNVGELDASQINKIEISELPIYAGVGTSGPVSIKIQGRATQGGLELYVTDIKPLLNFDIQQLEIPYGKEITQSMSIKISERYKGTFKPGQLVVELPKGIEVIDAPDISISNGDLAIGKSEVFENQLVIEIEDASFISSEIRIENLKVKISEDMPIGEYTLSLYGESLIPKVENIHEPIHKKFMSIKEIEYEQEDLNEDGCINIKDLEEITNNHNTTPVDETWNENYDFNQDGIIDIFDYIQISNKIQ